jgi:hypothetical protein
MKKLLLTWIVAIGTTMLVTSCSPTAPKSSDKEITAFSISSPVATGIIDTAEKTITVLVPRGTDLKALVVTFSTTGAKVSVGSIDQASGVTANDFTAPIVYTVTAEDNSTVNYTVTISAKKYCLFVSTLSDTGDPIDIPVKNKLLSWGYDLKVVGENNLTVEIDSFAQYDFAFLSESVNSSRLSPFKGHPLPILNLEAFACAKSDVLYWSRYPSAVNKYDPMTVRISAGAPAELTGNMSPSADFELVTATASPGEAQIGFIPTIAVIPIAVFKSDTLVNNMVAMLGIDSSAIAFTGGMLTSACAVEKGTMLADSLTVTVHRAVTIGIHAKAFLSMTDQAWALIRAGIDWILK